MTGETPPGGISLDALGRWGAERGDEGMTSVASLSPSTIDFYTFPTLAPSTPPGDLVIGKLEALKRYPGPSLLFEPPPKQTHSCLRAGIKIAAYDTPTSLLPVNPATDLGFRPHHAIRPICLGH